MKKACLLLLFVLMFLIGSAYAQTGTVNMKVVNCKEWVSLRLKPDQDSKRLKKVPLDAIVTDCEKKNATWTRATYEGVTGYIQTRYLTVVEDVAEENIVPAEPVVQEEVNVQPEESVEDDAGEQPQENILNATRSYHALIAYEEISQSGAQLFEHDGYKVFYAKSMEYGSEELKVACFAVDNTPLWGYVTCVEFATELAQTEVFIGGTVQEPCVMINNADLELAKIVITTGDVAWALKKDLIVLGGGLCHYTDADGTMYFASFENPDPVCITADGDILWESNAEDEMTFGPYSIGKNEEGLIVEYESGNETEHHESVFDQDGYLVTTRLVKRENITE